MALLYFLLDFDRIMANAAAQAMPVFQPEPDKNS